MFVIAVVASDVVKTNTIESFRLLYVHTVLYYFM